MDKETTTQRPDGTETQRFFTDWSKKAKDDAKDLAGKVTDWLNGSNHNENEFFMAMDREHRYLQGEFASFCVNYLIHCASPDFRFDPRNAHSVVYGKLMQYAIDHRNEIVPENYTYDNVKG